MQHAGFDGLHNPTGALLVFASALFLIAVILVGAYYVKLAMQREKDVRAKLKQQMEEQGPKPTA